MAAPSNVYVYEGKEPICLIKWKVEPGSQLVLKKVILTYKLNNKKNDESETPQKLESTVEGCVEKLLIKEGEVIQPGASLMTVGSCKHEVIMKELCAICGADLRHLSSQNLQEVVASRSFSMVHVVPELKCSLKKAEELDQADETRLLASRKLILLVDLDQTLIHTTNDNVPPDLKDVYHFQLYGSHSPWYHTRLRPHTQQFLERISKLYEMHIFTFGARPYAHKIVRSFLDPNQALFSHRILSRDECFDATSKTGNLKSLFPRGDSMVCIIDDREDVWNFAPNVIHVKPYIYFNNTGDINSPKFNKHITNACSPPILPKSFECPPKSPDNNEESSEKKDKIKQQNCELEKIAISSAIEDDSCLIVKDTNAKSSLKSPTEMDVEKTDEKSVLEMQEKNGKSKEKESIDTKNGEKVEIVNKINELVEKELTIEEEKNEDDVIIVEEKIQNDIIIIKENIKSDNYKKTELKENEVEQKKKRGLYDDDEDDYLLYLEEILIKIHHAFYNLYDESPSKDGVKKIPDLKKVIPYVRRRVLRGVNLVFSGVIPTNLAPEKSPLYTLAKSLGAEISDDLISTGPLRTTHVVASKAGTVKLTKAKRMGNIHIVTPSWLMCCSTRWERVDERLFPLKKSESPSILMHHKRNKSKTKKSHIFNHRKNRKEKSSSQVPSQSLQVMETCLDFTAEEIDNMGREVDEACTSSDNESIDDGDMRGMKRKISVCENRDNVCKEDKKSKSVSSESMQNATSHNSVVTNGSNHSIEISDSSSDDSVLSSSNDDELAAELERQIFNK